MTIYADEIFAVNVFSNELLLNAYCMLGGLKLKHGRIAAASAIGGVYAVIEAIFNLPRIMRAAVLFCMIYVVFGKVNIIKHSSKIMLVCFCVEGITLAAVSAMGVDAELARGGVTLFASEPVTAALYITAYPALFFINRIRKREKKYARLNVKYHGRGVTFDVLCDSGNLLKYHNKPVIMIAWEAAAALFDFKSYSELKEKSESFVIYETVSGAGVVPVIEPEKCVINGSEVDYSIAVVERKFKGRYCGIVGEI